MTKIDPSYQSEKKTQDEKKFLKIGVAPAFPKIKEQRKDLSKSSKKPLPSIFSLAKKNIKKKLQPQATAKLPVAEPLEKKPSRLKEEAEPLPPISAEIERNASLHVEKNVAEALGITEKGFGEVHYLFETIVDKITSTVDEGITTTTIYLKDHEAFRESEITIAHYDSAPHSFKIELSGPPESALNFQKHLHTLENSLNTHFHGFQINLTVSHKHPISHSSKKERDFSKKSHSKVHKKNSFFDV